MDEFYCGKFYYPNGASVNGVIAMGFGVMDGEGTPVLPFDLINPEKNYYVFEWWKSYWIYCGMRI